MNTIKKSPTTSYTHHNLPRICIIFVFFLTCQTIRFGKGLSIIWYFLFIFSSTLRYCSTHLSQLYMRFKKNAIFSKYKCNKLANICSNYYN